MTNAAGPVFCWVGLGGGVTPACTLPSPTHGHLE